MGKFDGCVSNIIVTINYLKSDLIKKQRAFKIGLVSIFMVVFFLTLLFNAIELVPSIFIKLSEEQSGEIDLILTPYLTSQNVETKKSCFDSFFYNKTETTPQPNNTNFDLSKLNFLNFYEIQEKLINLSFIEGVSPRWIITGQASNKNETKKIHSQFRTNIFILDSSIENNIGIGRELNLPELEEMECYISTTLGDALKIQNGDTIQVDIRLSDLLQAFSGGESGSEQEEGDLNPQQNNEQKTENNQQLRRLLNIINEIDDNINNKKDIEVNNEPLLKNNKFKSNKNILNTFSNTDLIKELYEAINKELINRKIHDNINELMILIDKYFPDLPKIKDLSSFSIKKCDLINLISQHTDTIKVLLNVLFQNNNIINSELVNNILKNELLFDILLNNPITSQYIIYNQTSDLIFINKTTLNKLFSMNFINYNNEFSQDSIIDNITQFLNFQLNLTVKERIKSTGGKWPSASGNVLAMDSRHIKDYLYLNAERIVDEIVNTYHMEALRQLIWNYINNFLKDFDINNYALTINAIFKDKFEIYKKDKTSMRHYLSEIAEDITTSLGANYQVNIEVPIYQIMSGVETAKLFLQDIFIGIMFFLWMLCVLLVYSLMLGNVDERTYEFGMLRSLGFKKNNLIFLIILQGFIFAVPGTILGLVTSYITNNFIAFLFNWYTALVMPFFLSSTNIIFGIVAGLSIPLISSYLPIKKCLDDNLRETLAIFNKKIGDIVVSIIKLENLGVSPTTLIASISLIVIGMLTYYVAPLSFILSNMSLFLFIMIGILLTMILGLIILTQLLVPYLQKFILKIIMIISFKDRNLNLIVLKNLEGHKRRDQQVSIMFMVALGFVIFAGCTLNLVVDFVENLAKGLIGGDFSVYLMDRNSPNMTLNEISINNYLKNIEINYPNLIQNYSYISWSSNDLLTSGQLILISRIGALNGYPLDRRNVFAIDKNFLDSTYPILYSISQYDKNLNISYLSNGEVDIIKMLYDNPNIPYLLQENNNSFIFPVNEQLRISQILNNFQINMIAAEGIRKTQAISVENPAKLAITQFIQHSIPCKIVAMANKLPGILTYSSYNTLASSSPVYISTDQMKKLIDIESQLFNIDFTNVINQTVDGVRKRQFILKYQDNSSKELREMIFFAMNNYLGYLNCFTIQLDDIIDISEKVKNVIGYIFLVLGIIALILSFFLIWTSFYSNIRENIAEYGIMRSIGITKAQSIRIYLYEAATIILTSIIIGTFIGIIISTSLILQFDIFIELPFIFNFPYKLYFILITVGLLLGLLGSYYPTYAVNTLSLVKIMKGFNE